MSVPLIFTQHPDRLCYEKQLFTGHHFIQSFISVMQAIPTNFRLHLL